jgi:hypothetical protein
MKRCANFPIRLQLSDLALRLAGALFTKGDAGNGDLGFRLTIRAFSHGYFNRGPGLFVLFKALNVNILFDQNGCNLYAS